MRILLIEDDRLIGDGIQAGLPRFGFTVDWFTEGRTGALAVRGAPYDAAVLDLTLPGQDGLEILLEWRNQGHSLPVLILSARDALEQRVQGLHTGADDYVCKPFALAELAARLQALIRRAHGQSAGRLRHGDVTLDPAQRSVTQGGSPVALSPKEFLVCELFLLHTNHVLTKAVIEEKLYAWGEELGSNTVEVHVHHLRRKLGADFIRTVHKVGYALGAAAGTPSGEEQYMKLHRLLAGKSLRLRLCVFFTLLVVGAWFTAAGFAWFESREHIDEFFDTQQMLFARQLAAMNFADSLSPSTSSDIGNRLENDDLGGEVDDDALGFAVFDAQSGRMILHDGEKGAHFPFVSGAPGFTDSKLRDGKKLWRIVRLPTSDGRYTVAVGQELRHRQKMTFELLWEQLTPWFFCLPLLLVGMVWLVHRELSPLRRITRTVAQRTPEDAVPLEEQGVPPEVLPLVAALNSLFARVAASLARERSFTADAAHELRTPLAALRVQAEVAQLAVDDAFTQSKALANLTQGSDRAARLVDQLLALSRLDGLSRAELSGKGLDWEKILAGVVDQHMEAAVQKGLTVTVEPAAIHEGSSRSDPNSDGSVPVGSEQPGQPGQSEQALPPPVGRRPFTQGHNAGLGPEDDPALMELLLRNILDNAIRYTPEGGSIRIALTAHELTVTNSGPGVAPEALPRLGERFFRPPGQEQTGSGLGLPIARRIAELYGLQMVYGNQKQAGFAVKIRIK